MKEELQLLNTVILSMITKQKVLNDLESKVFSVDIYGEYIESLTCVLLSLNNSPDKKYEYEENVKKYLEGKLEEPEEDL
ncbi:hypothetical protein [Natronospora cellulosivora (SeqCode)]